VALTEGLAVRHEPCSGEDDGEVDGESSRDLGVGRKRGEPWRPGRDVLRDGRKRECADEGEERAGHGCGGTEEGERVRGGRDKVNQKCTKKSVEFLSFP
jgi:hypothetical protein